MLTEKEKEHKKTYYEKHKDEIKQKAKEKYEKNKEEIKAKRHAAYLKNKDKINAARRERRKNDKEYRKQLKEEYKKYYAKNKEIAAAQNEKYHNENKEKLYEGYKKYYTENKEEILRKNKEYRIKNKDKNKQKKLKIQKNKKFQKILQNFYDECSGEKEIQNIYKKLCMKEAYDKWRNNASLNYKIAHRLSTRIRSALYNNGTKKSKRTIELIGCTIPELKIYLEEQFQDGMTWENHGEWHIDHILPCASFDLLDENEQHKCFHYTNLQPLWAFDNQSKSAKILEEYS